MAGDVLSGRLSLREPGDVEKVIEKNNNEERKKYTKTKWKYSKKCYQCDFTAKQRNHLKVHVDSNHDNVRYICDQCDYTATQKDQLKYHVESNYDETRYNCDQCDYSATRKDQLKHHVEVTHEKLFYNCEQCA